MLHLLVRFTMEDGPNGSGWYEDSGVITDFSGPMGRARAILATGS